MISPRVTRGIRRLVRLDRGSIMTALRGFGKFESGYLFVHSSLSGCGSIAGGAGTVIRSLREWIGAATLVMPTHTYCYAGSAPEAPVFDPVSTPSRVGAITESFRKEPGVIRSNHPTHSLCAQGAGSEALCRGHELCDTPCGKGTPYARLVREDCAVLMFGASMNTYTLFHTAEDEAGVPYLYEPNPCELRYRQDGAVKRMRMRRQDMTLARRFISMDRWLLDKNLVLKRRLGAGTLLFVPHAKRVHEALLAAMRDNPHFLLLEKARK